MSSANEGLFVHKHGKEVAKLIARISLYSALTLLSWGVFAAMTWLVLWSYNTALFTGLGGTDALDNVNTSVLSGHVSNFETNVTIFFVACIAFVRLIFNLYRVTTKNRYWYNHPFVPFATRRFIKLGRWVAGMPNPPRNGVLLIRTPRTDIK